MLPQKIYLYDGSLEGLLHAVAAAIKSAEEIKGIYPEQDYNPLLFETKITLHPDREQAFKLFKYLQSLEGNITRIAINCFLSEDPQAATHLYNLVQLCLKSGGGISKYFADESVVYLQNLSRKVMRESHRFKGFLRFRIFEDGLQYGPFEPDYNIIGYLAAHFKKRLPNNSWVLHDTHRNLAIYWDCKELQYIEIDCDFRQHVQVKGEVPDSMLTTSEKYYQYLWQEFHAAITNPERKNLPLQRQQMPRRYWKYLVEQL